MKMFCRTVPAVLSALLIAGATGADQETFTIKTLRAQMRYDVTDFEVRPAQKVKLIFQNTDDMPHNICFFQPGTDVVAVANKQMDKPEEALKRNWVPDDPRMWLYSKPVNPEESDELTFTAPEKVGVYPYVCTFPGHAAVMQGKMTVSKGSKPGPKLTDLKFRLYLGDWTVLPDFSKLTPHREGNVPDNLVQIKADDYKNQFGLVFTGKLDAPEDGEYNFQIASDDGSRLAIDGKIVVMNNGIHPSNVIREGKTKLKKGTHDFSLEYFQAAGQMEIFAAWSGPEFGITPLSKWVHPNLREAKKGKKKEETSGMPLAVAQEPILYRNFITAAGNRAIGVGFPGNANIAWSAESMNLAIAWRGAFIDAARHWNSRGGGYQPPLGFDVFRPTELSPPFAVLADGGTWPTMDKSARAAGYIWRGYELDAKRIPSFHYEWQGVKVTERYEVIGDALAGQGKIVRTLKLEGRIPERALFRIAGAPKITPRGTEFLVEGGRFSGDISTDGKFLISAEGATLKEGNLTVPVRPEMKVTYGWPTSHGSHAHAK